MRYAYLGRMRPWLNPPYFSDTQLVRQSPVEYSDGVYEPAGRDRPNPLEISKVAHQGKAGLQSYAGRTALLVYFGKNGFLLSLVVCLLGAFNLI